MAEQKKRVLIVEDEGSIGRALQLKLQGEGFDAEIAGNGKLGLEKLSSGDYDVALLDLVMPVMDGFAVLEGLKEKGIKTPVIVSTNLSQPEDEERVRALGAKDYLVKSNTPINEIIERVKKLA